MNNLSIAPTTANLLIDNFCIGEYQNITLSYQGGTIGTDAIAKWYDNASLTTPIGTGNDVVIPAPSTTTTYYVRFEGECNTTEAIEVEVTVKTISEPPTNVTASHLSYCQGEVSLITLIYEGGTLGTGAIAYWYNENNVFLGQNNNLKINAPTTTATYYVMFEGNCNTTSKIPLTITVNNESIAPTTANVDINNFCYTEGSNITLSYSGGTLQINDTAKWYSNAELTDFIGKGNNIIIPAPETTTTYYVRFEGICNITQAVSIPVTVNTSSQPPTSVTASHSGYCQGHIDKITLNYTGGTFGTNATANWYDDETLINSLGTEEILEINAPTETTTYYLQFKGECNTITETVKIEVGAPSEIEICNDTTIYKTSFANLWVTQDNNFQYEWTPFETLNNANIFNPTATPLQTTTYTVIVKNHFGCETTENVTVQVLDFEIIINTGFTPNEDGHNDTWIIKDIEHFPDNHVQIYNRQGVLVFETDAYKNQWKGTYLNTDKELPVGVYYFLLDLNDGITPTQKGSVTIIR